MIGVCYRAADCWMIRTCYFRVHKKEVVCIFIVLGINLERYFSPPVE
ncbi:unnamed protein product [Pylaiella littoralis]